MANVISPTLLARYLAELRTDEMKVNRAADDYETAKASLDVNLRRYIALRDYITEQSGENPYAPTVNWPEDPNADWGTPTLGRFRFTGMRAGDAILQLLRDRANTPAYQYRQTDSRMTLGEIVAALSEGGLGFPDQVQARAINAALLRPPLGVVREDALGGTARYYYDPHKEEEIADARREHLEGKYSAADDLPFE